MRHDAPDILRHLGFVLDVDFVAFGTKDGAEIKWLSQAPLPDAKAIDAAALELAAAEQAKEVQRIEADTARDDAKRALSALDTIIGGIDAANLTQAKAAIRQLAQIQKHIILALVGR